MMPIDGAHKISQQWSAVTMSQSRHNRISSICDSRRAWTVKNLDTKFKM